MSRREVYVHSCIIYWSHQGSSAIPTILADLDGTLVAEFAIVPNIVVTTLRAEAVSAAHAVVDLADLYQPTVVLVGHLECPVALRVLALERQVLWNQLLWTLEHLNAKVFRDKMLSPLHVLVVILNLNLLLLGELAPIVQNQQLLRGIPRNILDERRLPVELFHVFELQSRLQILAVAEYLNLVLGRND